MTTLVFGHKSPDTDSTGSPILWAWYLNEVMGGDAEAVLLGEPNTEAAFMLDRWKLEKPEIIDDVAEGQVRLLVHLLDLLELLSQTQREGLRGQSSVDLRQGDASLRSE